MQDRSALLLAWLLRNCSTPALQLLNLSRCKLAKTGAAANASVLSTNSTLAKLELEDNHFQDHGVQALAHVLGETSLLCSVLICVEMASRKLALNHLQTLRVKARLHKCSICLSTGWGVVRARSLMLFTVTLPCRIWTCHTMKSRMLVQSPLQAV